MSLPEHDADRDEDAPRLGIAQHIRSMFKVGVIGFGGGSALIPVMEKELVVPRGLSEREFVQDTVIANITPGALPVKLGALAGARLQGSRAAIAGMLAVALPGTLGTVLLMALFSSLGPDAIAVIEYASLGITAFILYLLAHYVLKVIRPGGRWQLLSVAIAIAAFLVSGGDKTLRLVAELLGVTPSWQFPELSALGLVIAAIAAIVIVTAVQAMRRRLRAGEGLHDTAVAASAQGGAGATLTRRVLRSIALLLVLMVAGAGVAMLLMPPQEVLAFFGIVAFSTVSSFGGGEAYVGVADGFFVAPGMVSTEVFYGQIVPVANALPGPILVKIASALGFVIGTDAAGMGAGIALAVGAFLISAASCTAIALAMLAAYDRASGSLLVRNIGTLILPVICGLLASTSVSMLHSNARISEAGGLPAIIAVLGTIALASAVPLLRRWFRLHDVLLILLFGALSLTVLLLV